MMKFDVLHALLVGARDALDAGADQTARNLVQATLDVLTDIPIKGDAAAAADAREAARRDDD